MRSRRAAAFSALAAATALLFVISRGKWSDAIIDSGREWIVPDALSRGALLYRDVVYWFGPFTPYLHAALFWIFGSSFVTLAGAGILAAVAALAALHLALRRVTGPREARIWTALAIPVLVFMPNAGGPLLGMGYRMWHAATFALLAVALASGPSHRRAFVSLGCGACAALAGLCRTEWGIAALVASLLAGFLRRRDREEFGRDAIVLVLSFAALFALVLGGFVRVAGAGAVLQDGHVLLTSLPVETRTFALRYSGLENWRHGILELGYSAASGVGLVLLIQAVVFWKRDARRLRRLASALGACLLLLVATVLAGGASGSGVFSAAPLLALAGLGVGLSRRRGSTAAVLAGSGGLGVLLSYRRLFHIGDAAYVGPPLLFVFVSAAGLLRLLIAREKAQTHRRPLRRALVILPAALAVVAFAGRFAQYAADERVPIPGTGGMLSARPEAVARITEAAALLRTRTPDGSGLVVFPEGEILNFLSGRRNPIRHKLYIPGYLTAQNEGAVLAELERGDPSAAAIFFRVTSEYGPGIFGEDYGRRIGEWVRARYALQSVAGDRIAARTGSRLLIGLRRPAAAYNRSP
ncbi:MAG TPA: hypothetical protein VMR54_09420 [Thermoanaerobaculia bacterium]|nr:hypothetical protein [Thermoanaerobaculia bacterium]